MIQYKHLVEKVYSTGELSPDRTGTGTRRIFGHTMHFDLAEGFPLVTLKYTPFKTLVHELLWFITGSTNIKYLRDNNVKIWDEWADPFGEVGPMYGSQWRNSQGRLKVGRQINRDGVDQLQKVITDIRERPHSRRIIIDCWDTKKIPDDDLSPIENVSIGNMALAPCHMFMQFFVSQEDKLSMIMYQRSVDSFLGLPFNIASYAALLHMIAQVTGKTPGVFTWMGGDVHLYNNHIPQVEEMLVRQPKKLPQLEINTEITNIEDFQIEDFILKGYEYHPKLAGAISV